MAPHSIVKVTSERTGRLKRWESETGRPLAIVERGKLVLTDLGRKRGYTVSGMRLMKDGLPAF